MPSDHRYTQVGFNLVSVQVWNGNVSGTHLGEEKGVQGDGETKSKVKVSKVMLRVLSSANTVHCNKTPSQEKKGHLFVF